MICISIARKLINEQTKRLFQSYLNVEYEVNSFRYAVSVSCDTFLSQNHQLQ